MRSAADLFEDLNSADKSIRIEAKRASEGATLLGKDRYYRRNRCLIPIMGDGRLRFRCSESAKHSHQAHLATQPREL
ncbi:TPA: hypothetical protein NHK41_005926 [Pseudomonas aeruginosa]|nr:hypothetical protein [Pseudomonas aeruginosa]